MSLRDITLKTEYRTLKDNIAKDFYIPALKQSISYKRAVGFFSSTILAMITDGLYELYQNGGYIQILASPRLSDEDIEAIRLGYENRDIVIKNAVVRELRDYEDFKTRDRLNLLACLIAEGRLDFEIVEPMLTNGSGMYHEKVGIITDEDGNIVAFSGSMNESSNAVENNYESFDVFCSWKTADEERVMSKVEAFNRLWEDQEENVKVFKFPEVKELFITKYQTDDKCLLKEKDYSAVAESKVKYGGGVEVGNSIFVKPKWLQLYDYQLQAVNNWQKHNYRGIFDMATGTGKTYTG